MRAHDLAMLTGDELAARLGDSRRELFNLRFQLATGQLDNPSRIGYVRRDVARMLTVLRTREILEAEGAYVAPSAAEHEAAQAALAAEDAAVAEKAEARRAATEAETVDEDDHIHVDEGGDDIDDVDDIDDIDDEDDEDDETEEEA
jgi:large subunit ribosomal protein L29